MVLLIFCLYPERIFIASFVIDIEAFCDDNIRKFNYSTTIEKRSLGLDFVCVCKRWWPESGSSFRIIIDKSGVFLWGVQMNCYDRHFSFERRLNRCSTSIPFHLISVLNLYLITHKDASHILRNARQIRNWGRHLNRFRVFFFQMFRSRIDLNSNQMLFFILSCAPSHFFLHQLNKSKQ